jgi:hypothetical protein
MSVSDSSPDIITRAKVTQFTGSLTSQIVSTADPNRKFLRFFNRTNQAAYLSVTDSVGAISEIGLLSASYGEYTFPFNFQGTIHAKWTTAPTTGKFLEIEFYE